MSKNVFALLTLLTFHQILVSAGMCEEKTNKDEIRHHRFRLSYDNGTDYKSIWRHELHIGGGDRYDASDEGYGINAQYSFGYFKISKLFPVGIWNAFLKGGIYKGTRLGGGALVDINYIRSEESDIITGGIGFELDLFGLIMQFTGGTSRFSNNKMICVDENKGRYLGDPSGLFFSLKGGFDVIIHNNVGLFGTITYHNFTKNWERTNFNLGIFYDFL